MVMHSEQKRRQMARSVLPAKAQARRGVRQARRYAHHQHRTRCRDAMNVAPLDDDFDEVRLSPVLQRDIRLVVQRRRSADKLGPFLRWANANAAALGATPQQRLAAMRGLLPGGIVGDHALSHLTFEPAFCVDPTWSDPWLRWQAAKTRRQRDLQSLRDRLHHRLGLRLDQVGELNAALKATHRVTAGDGGPPRLWAGAHDTNAFTAAIIEQFEQSVNRNPGPRTWIVVFRFVGIDPTNPLARGPAGEG